MEFEIFQRHSNELQIRNPKAAARPAALASAKPPAQPGTARPRGGRRAEFRSSPQQPCPTLRRAPRSLPSNCMALQDLTPQLRTRLSRMERAVGWFVMLALAALVFGFAYYVYHTAERKGWFLTKAPYYTYAASGSGLKVGERVTLMGYDAGA